MEWTNDLSVSHLFLTHDITVAYGADTYVVHIPSLREQIGTAFYSMLIQLFQPQQFDEWRKLIPNLDKGTLLQMLMTDPTITNLVEFRQTSHLLHQNINKVLPQFKIENRKLFSGTAPLTDEALSEILYILQLGIGKNIEKPQHFGPGEEAAKRFYERSMAAKAKAEKIRSENQHGDHDGLMSMFTLISYRFPIYSFEQMYDMTMMQLHYLHATASAMLGYEHGMMAYTAGNLKKAPQFFLK